MRRTGWAELESGVSGLASARIIGHPLNRGTRDIELPLWDKRKQCFARVAGGGWGYGVLGQIDASCLEIH